VRIERRRAAVLVALLAAVPACPRQEEGGTRLLVTFERAAGTPALEHLLVTWVGGGKVYKEDERVPAQGSLPDLPVLGTFQIAVSEPDSWRIVVARGYAGGVVVAEGAIRERAVANTVTAVKLQLLPGRLPDVDSDGIPEPPDNCPGEPNQGQGEPCGDAGAGGGGGDAGEPEAGDPPDTGLPPDSSVPPADAGPDGAPPDLGSGKTARGGACVAGDECETGRCADSRVGKFCASPGMLVVPAGQFARGCLAKDTQCAADERPQRMVMLSGFEINQTEVTQSEYDACVKAGVCPAPSGFNPGTRPNHPVGNITFDMATKYCTWAGKRLPTEAEWEKAARGPASTVYPWGDGAPNCSQAQYKGCGPADSVAVAFLAGTSGYGIEDMGGNVAEWVKDFYASNYYAGAPATDPPGPPSGMHLRRGGGFTSDPPALRTGARAASDSTAASVGFRCARSL